MYAVKSNAGTSTGTGVWTSRHTRPPELVWKPATLGFLFGFTGRLEMDLGVGERVGGKIEAVFPKVTPDPKDSFEWLAYDTARKRLEGNRPIVLCPHQRAERGLEVDRT